MEESLDLIPPLAPLDFFDIEGDLLTIDTASLTQKPKKKWALVSTRDLGDIPSSFEAYGGWLLEGLWFSFVIPKPFEDLQEEDFRKGDSLELFIDTRDIKTTSFLTKFCHHFVFFPKPLEGLYGKEITRFRAEDRHDLCDPTLLQLQGTFQSRSYSVQIFLPSQSLYGYDPTSFQRLGFSYRINRLHKTPICLIDSSKGVMIENHPSRWPSLTLGESG